MKKILFVIPTLRMGGAEKSLVSLLRAMDPARAEVDLLMFEDGGVLQKDVPEWVRVRVADPVTRAMTLEMRTYFPDLIRGGHFAAGAARFAMTLRSRLSGRLGPAFGWGRIARFIPEAEGRYDVAVGFLEGFADFYVLDKVQADRKIGWIHTDMSGRAFPEEEAGYYARFDALATISEQCREAFAAAFPLAGRKIRVVENIVLPEEVRKKAAQPVWTEWAQDRLHLVTVGRLDYQKGIDIAARACRVLLDRGEKVCWHIYGKGVMHDEIASYGKENGLEGSFLLEGLTENPYPYLRQAAVVVQPSRWEGKSLVLDEAKILGKAIVATNYPSVGDQLQDNVTGILTGMEPEALAEGIQRVLHDDELRARLEENCLRQANRSIQAVDKVYEMLGI